MESTEVWGGGAVSGDLLSKGSFAVALFQLLERPLPLDPPQGTAPTAPSHRCPRPGWPATFLCPDVPLGLVGHERVGAQVLQFAVGVADEGDVGGLEVPATERHALPPAARRGHICKPSTPSTPRAPNPFSPRLSKRLLGPLLVSVSTLSHFKWGKWGDYEQGNGRSTRGPSTGSLLDLSRELVWGLASHP